MERLGQTWVRAETVLGEGSLLWMKLLPYGMAFLEWIHISTIKTIFLSEVHQQQWAIMQQTNWGSYITFFALWQKYGCYISSDLLTTACWRACSNILERNSERKQIFIIKMHHLNIKLGYWGESWQKIMQILLVFCTEEISEQFKVLNFIHIHLNNFRFILSQIILSSIPQSNWYHQFGTGAVAWNWWHRKILAQPKWVYVINFLANTDFPASLVILVMQDMFLF